MLKFTLASALIVLVSIPAVAQTTPRGSLTLVAALGDRNIRAI